RHGRKPVRSPETVVVTGRLAGLGEPVGPFPAEFFAEHRAGGAQVFIQWRAAQRPPARMLLAGPGDGVVLAVQFQRAGAHPVDVPMRRAESPYVHRPQIARGLPRHDPLGQHLTGAAAGGDAEGVESRSDVEAVELRRRSEDEVTVRREAFRSVDEFLGAGAGQARYTRHRLIEDRLKMLP